MLILFLVVPILVLLVVAARLGRHRSDDAFLPPADSLAVRRRQDL